MDTLTGMSALAALSGHLTDRCLPADSPNTCDRSPCGRDGLASEGLGESELRRVPEMNGAAKRNWGVTQACFWVPQDRTSPVFD